MIDKEKDGNMNPTPEQLNQWSAEALGSDKFIFEHHPPIKPIVFYGHGHDKGVLFSPATDLSQAWREFCPVLNEKMFYPFVLGNAGGVVDLRDFENKTVLRVECLYVKNYVKNYDKNAAYSLTYAFVQIFRPPGYVEWKEAA